MKIKGWLGYLIGGALFSNGFAGTGAAVLGISMLIDWKIWILGILAFVIGFNWR